MGHTLRILLAIVAAGIAGCATTDKPKEEDRVSSIPWAKPEGWEGQGAFGGMMQGAR
jgi:hypothetical protein